MRNRYLVGLVSLALTAVTAVLNGTAWAESPTAPESAVWVGHEFTFVYKGFTTKYACDSLQTKMKAILLKLGARPDIEVRRYGCTNISGPDPLPGVSVKMHVLQPAASQNGAPVPAHWTTVDFVAGRDQTDVSGECELVDQVRRDVLPLFTTRNVVGSTPCVPRKVIIGTPELKADVLMADQRAAAR